VKFSAVKKEKSCIASLVDIRKSLSEKKSEVRVIRTDDRLFNHRSLSDLRSQVSDEKNKFGVCLV